MRGLRAADRRATPWKNGGGVTHEVLTSPEGAGLDVFDWRISIATIDRDGPFSSFPGIERKLAVIRGRVILSIGGQQTLELTPRSAPLRLAGTELVHARPLNGPVMDLNVMARQGRFESTLRRHALGAPRRISACAESCVIVSLGRTRVAHGGEPAILDDLDALLIAGPADLELAPLGKSCDCYVIEITRQAGTAHQNRACEAENDR